MKKKLNGYIIRDEKVLEGDSSSSGITQIVTEGTRVSKGEPVFRYYSDNEQEITNQIEQLNIEIDKALSQEENQTPSPDIISLEQEIKQELEEMNFKILESIRKE